MIPDSAVSGPDRNARGCWCIYRAVVTDLPAHVARDVDGERLACRGELPGRLGGGNGARQRPGALEHRLGLLDRNGVAGVRPLDEEGVANQPRGGVEIRAHGPERQVYGDEVPDMVEPETRHDADHRAEGLPAA